MHLGLAKNVDKQKPGRGYKPPNWSMHVQPAHKTMNDKA